jgi:hypothetical protein
MLKAIVGTTSSVNPPTSNTLTKLVLPDDCRPTTETSSVFVQNNDVNQVHQDENQDVIRNKGSKRERRSVSWSGSGGSLQTQTRFHSAQLLLFKLKR